jgi:hypothetical protein
LIERQQEQTVSHIPFSSLMDIEPVARELFGFKADEIIEDNPKYAFHADQMVMMIETAVAFLGPDLEFLEEDFKCLGERHIAYGVQAKYFPAMVSSRATFDVPLKREKNISPVPCV